MEINDYFTMSDELDKDGDIECEYMTANTEIEEFWINKDQAQKIVDHLTKVFELKEE